MTPRAALGFKLHTGWAAAVAVCGNAGKIQVPLRRRMELLPADHSVPRFVYHEGSELPLFRAAELVTRATKAAANAARHAVQEALQDLGSHGFQVEVCGVLSGSKSVPDDLSAILRSHPLIHAAEGALFQKAIVSACESCGLRVVLAREREVWANAAEAFEVAELRLRREVDNVRKVVGPPWSADHKFATALALLALRSKKN